MSGTPICGYVAVWSVTSGVIADERGARHRLVAERGCLDAWLTLELAAPLAVQHEPVLLLQGGLQYSIGAVRQFRPDPFGLLAFGELDDTELAAGVEHAIRQGWLWAFSVGWATNAEIPNYRSPLVVPTVRMAQAAIREVSVTSQPGFPDCKIVGIGETATFAWQFPDLAGMALQARGDQPPPSPRSRRW